MRLLLLVNKKGDMDLDRIGRVEYYLKIAESVTQRSTCLNRQYGAVIVKNDEIISTGYNGAPRNHKNCCDVGTCWRRENKIPHGERYEECIAVHAEQNAIISASRRDMIDSTLYLVGFKDGKKLDPKDVQPCKICERMIANAGIHSVIVE